MPGTYSVPLELDIPWWAFDLAVFLLLGLFAALHVWGYRQGHVPIALSGALGFLTVAYGSFVEPRLLTVRRYAFGEGERVLRVAFLSDIHVGPYKGEAWVKKLVDRTNALKPDLILLGGDFLYKEAKALPELAPLKALRSPLGVFAILGNHDEWKARHESLAWFEAAGIPLLLNRSARLAKEGVSFSIAGVDDDWYGETDLALAFKDIGPDEPAIVMLHNPDLAPPASELLKNRPGPAFFFSGHTHGGQIRLPLLGSVSNLPHYLGRKYDMGIFHFRGIPLVIGAGAGESGPRARLFCPPEIVLAEVRY